MKPHYKRERFAKVSADVMARAREIDPCCWKSYSGSSRTDAQDAAVAQAAHEIAVERRREPARYSVFDLDRMRKAIRGNPALCSAFHEHREKRIEDVLRTFMLNGTTPAELEAAQVEQWEIIKARREARQAEVRRRDMMEAARVTVLDSSKWTGRPDQVQVELTNETPHITAAKLTADLPMTLLDRVRLRSRSENAIREIIARFK